MTITSRQLMASLGIKNIKTLTRWYQLQVIPEPAITLHPGGIGRIASWPVWVKKHGRIVKKLLSEGRTLKEVAATFGTNWAAIEARYRRYDFATVSESIGRRNYLRDVYDAVYEMVALHLGDIRKRLEATSFPPLTSDVLNQALDLMQHGLNPVLILSSKRIVAVPDFVLSLHLARHHEDRDPFLVVPLFALLAQCDTGKRWSRTPSVQPVNKVKLGDKGRVQRAVLIGDDWSFEIQTAGGRSTPSNPESRPPE